MENFPVTQNNRICAYDGQIGDEIPEATKELLDVIARAKSGALDSAVAHALIDEIAAKYHGVWTREVGAAGDAASTAL